METDTVVEEGVTLPIEIGLAVKESVGPAVIRLSTNEVYP